MAQTQGWPSNPSKSSRYYYFWSWTMSFSLLCGLCWFLILHRFHLNLDPTRSVTEPLLNERQSPPNTQDQPAPWDFENIPSSAELIWYPCLEKKYKCAKLAVPMDYARPISSNRPFTVPVVNLALLMLPASNNASMSSLSPSPIVLNPGGPGGSGVEWLVSMGEYIRTILGPSVDIIGFDPRGVGRSTPKADCFGSSGGTNEAEAFAAFQRTSWGVDTQLAGVVNSTYSTLEKLDTRYRTLGKLCQYRHDKFGNDSIFKYLHTRDSARDMLSIVDAWDRQFPKASRVSLEGADVTATDSSWSRGKLHYWGWSYGSHLGTTFASMFPNRVGRMLLDGIIDAEGYSDPVWIDSIQDADSVFASFFRYCYEAGKDRCAFYPQQDAAVVDPSSIEARYRRLVARLKENPLKIVTILPDVGPVPQIITHDLVKSAIWSSLYSPIQSFPAIAQMLDLLDRGDEFEIGAANLFPGTILDYRPYCVKESDGVRIPESMRGVREALYTIMCSDKSEPLNKTIPELHELYDKMALTSSWADVWLGLNLGCSKWPIPNASKCQPPHCKPDNGKPIKTSHPILFISTKADPVTPLYAARKMSEKFVGSGLVTQLNEGHCSISAVSACTLEAATAYFREGKLPRNGKISCSVDEKPWKPLDGQLKIKRVDSKTEKDSERAERVGAWKEMQQVFAKQGLWQV